MIRSSRVHLSLSLMRFYFLISVGSLGLMAENGTLVTEFVLLGFQLSAELQTGLFFVFLLLYLITLGGNLGLMALIQSDPRLQTPMYFFLGHLSFLDICYSSVIVPQLLETLRTGKRTIPFDAVPPSSSSSPFVLVPSASCWP